MTEAIIRPASLEVAQQHLRRGSFPHMSRADTAVWRKFLAAPPIAFDWLDYDVSFGGCGVGESVSLSAYGRMWQELLKKRVDVVGFFGQEFAIMEIKPTANTAALGQVLAYDWLARHEAGWEGRTRKVVICEEIDPDLAGVFTCSDVCVYACGVLAGTQAVTPRLVAGRPLSPQPNLQ